MIHFRIIAGIGDVPVIGRQTKSLWLYISFCSILAPNWWSIWR